MRWTPHRLPPENDLDARSGALRVNPRSPDALTLLGDHLLRDIGLTRSAAIMLARRGKRRG